MLPECCAFGVMKDGTQAGWVTWDQTSLVVALPVGIMAKVLSLMATHSGDRSQYFKSAAEIDDQLLNIEEDKGYVGTPYRRCVHAGRCYIKCVHTRSYPVQEVRTPSSLTLRKRKAHVGFSYVLPLVFSRRYCVIMVLVCGIDPWFEEELAYIKQRRSFDYVCFWVEHLMRARSEILWSLGSNV